MKKLLLKVSSCKRLRSILSLVLVATLILGAVNIGSIGAMATSDPSIVYFEQDGITGSKSVAMNNMDGTVNITFSVVGSDTTTTTQKIMDTDIVFVMDTSYSMTSSKRLEKAKEAAQSFVNNILSNKNIDHVKIGIASFNKNGNIDQRLTNDAATVNRVIDKLSTGNGTNIQAGIKKAEEILEEDTRSNVNKIIIILSDGNPSYSFQATKAAPQNTPLNDGINSIRLLTLFNYSSLKGSGSSYNLKKNGNSQDSSYNVGSGNSKRTVSDNGDPTISESYIAKNKGITIYSIAYDTSDDENAVYVMKNVASKYKYYEASSTASASDITSNAIANIMTSISEKVDETIAAGRGAQIVDKLPSYLTAIEVIPSEGTTAFVDNVHQVTWIIGELPANMTKSLTIRAALNKDAMLANNGKEKSNLTNGVWFDMNNEATLTYTKADGKVGTCPIKNPQLQFTTREYTVNYYEDGTYVGNSIKHQFIGDNASFGNTQDYLLHTEKYDTSKTLATTDTVTLLGNDGNWSFVVPSNVEMPNDVTIRVDYYKKEFPVNYYETKIIDDKEQEVLLSTQIVKYGENAVTPSTDGLGYEYKGYKFSFSNWDIQDENITGMIITGPTDIHARYSSEQIKFVAGFYANTGDTTPVETQNIFMNSEDKFLVATSSVTPVYKGSLAEGVDYMKFDGWDFDFTTSITGNVKIYAKYKPVLKTFTVQFHDMDEAKTVMTDFTKLNVIYGTGVEIPTYPNADVRTADQVRFFTGWTDKAGNSIDFSSIKADTEAFASYRFVDRFYTVTWYPENDVDADIQIHDDIEYGSNDSWWGEAPTKIDKTGEYTYEFMRWNAGANGPVENSTVRNVTSNIDMTPSYVGVRNTFLYKFVYYILNSDGSNVKQETIEQRVEWGSKLSAPAFEREITATVSGSGIWTNYSFIEWSNEDFQSEEGIKAEGTATASYNSANTYLVTFVAEDEKIVKTIKVNLGDIVPEGEVPAVPLKAADNIYTYTQPTWGAVTAPITEPTTFTASYTPVDRKYTVSVNVYLDGTKVDTLTQTSLVGLYEADVTGEYAAIVNGLNVDGNKYQFSEITGATLSGATYTCKIKGNGQINIFFVEEPKYQITYCRTNMVAKEEGSLELEPVHTNTVIDYSDAVYKDGAINNSWEYDKETAAAAFNNAKYTYSFAGWVEEDGTPFDDKTVTADKKVYESFKPTINSYTVTFFDYKEDPDTAVADRAYTVKVAEETVEYGESVTIPAVPTREDTDKYHYTAHTWNIAESKINPVTGNLVVNAEHTCELQTYNITFIDHDGNTVIKSENAGYGTEVSVPTEPKRPDSDDSPDHAHYYYTFDKWVKVDTVDDTTGKKLTTSSVVVSGPAVYKAVYTEHEYTFKVTFLNEGETNFGEKECQTEVTWGKFVKDETKDAARKLADTAATEKSTKLFTYTFAGWKMKKLVDNKETMVDATMLLNGEIKNNLTVYASYLDTKNVYTITYMREDGSALDPVPVTAGDKFAVDENGLAKESTNTKVFTFSHWVEKVPGEDGSTIEKQVSVIESVEENHVLYPVYKESTRLYSVNFVNYDGSSLGETQYVEFGESATAPAKPSRPDDYTSTTRTKYKFSGWDEAFSKIKADTTITAKYSSVTYSTIVTTTTTTPTTTPTTPTTVTTAPTPVVEDIEDITDEIPEGTPEIPQGTPWVDDEDDQLPAEDTTDEVLDVTGDEIPEGTPDLPKTGTAPVGIFYGLGAACAIIGAFIIISGRKKKEDCE